MSEQRDVLPTNEAWIEKRVYLATPYSSTDPDPSRRRTVEAARFNAIAQYVGVLHNAFPSIAFYSPILHWHPVAILSELRTDATYWQSLNDFEIKRSDELWVACFPWWGLSKGVTVEAIIALSLAVPVIYETLYAGQQIWPADYRGEAESVS